MQISFMAATPHHPLLRRAIDEVVKNVEARYCGLTLSLSLSLSLSLRLSLRLRLSLHLRLTLTRWAARSRCYTRRGFATRTSSRRTCCSPRRGR